MSFFKYLSYTVLTAAIAGALYLTHRESYIEGFKKGNFVGQQTAAKQLLRNLDEEVMVCRVEDDRQYKLPSFREVERTTPEGRQDDFLELRVDCGQGELSIPLRKVTPPLPGKPPLGW